jgi:hypothetical protein
VFVSALEFSKKDALIVSQRCIAGLSQNTFWRKKKCDNLIQW